MGELRGVLGLLLLVGVAVLLSRHRRGISWRTLLVALALQVGFALLVLGRGPGAAALGWVSARFETLIGDAEEGTSSVFGPLLGVTEGGSAASALSVLPVVVFLGALIGLLLHLRVVQHLTHDLGGALGRLLRVSDVESVHGATVVLLGMSEALLMIAPYLRRLRTAQVFTVMTGGLGAAAGSTLVGCAVLGAPLEHLLAATVVDAPAGLLMAKTMWPDSLPETEDEQRTRLGLGPDDEVSQDPADQSAHTDVRRCRDTEPAWSAAARTGSSTGQQTVLDELVAPAASGPQVDQLAPTTVAVVTSALAGFADFSSIAIQIGVLSSLHPPLRPVVARLGLRALLAGSLADLCDAAVAGVVVSAPT